MQTVENKFCAFIDILGFKNKMLNFQEALNYYQNYFDSYKAFASAHQSLCEAITASLNSGTEASCFNSTVSNYTFSDSVILVSADFKALLFKIANVMSFMLDSGFLFRGGIGYGKHYENFESNNMQMVSEGLVFAVETEGKIAKYPRIVLHESAMDKICDSLDSLYELNNILIQGEDDFWFINPFFLSPDIESTYNLFKESAEIYKNESFSDKYTWMIELCEYFMAKEDIRQDSESYFEKRINPYSKKTPENLFFYPKIYQFASPQSLNYRLDKYIYGKTFEDNAENILEQIKIGKN